MRFPLGWSYGTAQAVTLALAGILTVLLAILGYRWWRDSRVTPEERERRRRDALAAHGKMGDAVLVEIREDVLFYTYAVRGVEYTASQDVSALAERVPGDYSSVASVAVKFDPRNPANSIVLAEGWSGLRVEQAAGDPHNEARGA
ncbi:MAG: hypothetical protein ABSH40_18390 [Bryobacteraceae bacterium]|jgi:hypothetical protein